MPSIDEFDLDLDFGAAESQVAVLTEPKSEPLPETPKPEEPSPRRRKVVMGVLNFDLETVPDYSRRELFELDEIPEPKKRTVVKISDGSTAEASASHLLKDTVAKIESALRVTNPTDDYLDVVEAVERKAEKPRKGVFDVINELRNQDADRLKLIASQTKAMSVTPEMCRIVALGWSIDGGIPNSLVDGVEGITEVDILDKFWSLARNARTVCGFNIIGFDLPVIFTRSVIHGIEPTRAFDMKPWGTDVLDLMAKRWPKGPAINLKKLCRLFGIKVPAEGVDGAEAESLWRNDPLRLGQYVRSDVCLVEELFHMYRGFFF